MGWHRLRKLIVKVTVPVLIFLIFILFKVVWEFLLRVVNGLHYGTCVLTALTLSSALSAVVEGDLHFVQVGFGELRLVFLVNQVFQQTYLTALRHWVKLKLSH